MGKLVINSHKEFEQYIGKVLGYSPYLKITQDQINKFADATLDHQWIHTDPERALRESPFKKTIAHGYLALSVIPYLWEEVAQINNVKMLVNYGIEKLRFNQPVLVDNEVRLKVSLDSIVDLRGISKAQLQADLEIKDSPKPAFTSTITFLYHFK